MAYIVPTNIASLILVAAMVLSAVFGLVLVSLGKLNIRYIATLWSFCVAITPLCVLIWNTTILLIVDGLKLDPHAVTTPGDFDNPMIIYAAGYAVFHTVADLFSGIRDSIAAASGKTATTD